MNSLGPDSGVHNNLINVIRDITNQWALQLTNHFFLIVHHRHIKINVEWFKMLNVKPKK